MSYSSRVHRQRNPKPKEESKDEAFFSRQHAGRKDGGKNAFFQPGAVPAASVQKKESDTVQRVAAPAEPEQEKKDVQMKAVDKQEEESPVQKKSEPDKEQKEVQKKESAPKEDEPKGTSGKG